MNKEQIEKYVINNYYKKQNKEILNKLNITFHTLKKILIKNNLSLKGSGIKNSMNNIDTTPNKDELTDYVLGLIASDGSIQKTDRSSRVIFASMDKELFEIFKLKFPKTNLYNWNRSNVNPKWKDIYYAYFNSKEIVAKLIQLGITTKKASTLNYKYISFDFIRGYFDGDGSIRVKDNSLEFKITSSSQNQLQIFKDFLEKNNIKSTIRFSRNSYDLFVYNKENNYKLFKALYSNKKHYLQRKYKIIADYFSNEI